MRHLDISHVRDIRTGKGVRVPKDPKVREVLSMGTPGDLEDKTVTIVYSTDFVNVYFVNFYTRTSDVAKVSASCSTYWLMRSGMVFFYSFGPHNWWRSSKARVHSACRRSNPWRRSTPWSNWWLTRMERCLLKGMLRGGVGLLCRLKSISFPPLQCRQVICRVAQGRPASGWKGVGQCRTTLTQKWRYQCL